jgi:hypothetical protein
MKITKFEKAVTILGFLGFCMLVPSVLQIFQLAGFLEPLLLQMGALGKPSVLTLIGFGLITFTLFMGGGNNLKSIILGIIVGFLLVATAIDISFMSWYKNLTSQFFIFNNQSMNYILGIIVLMLGLALSFVPKLSFWKELLVLGVLPLGFMALSEHLDLFPKYRRINLSLTEGYDVLSKMIDQKYLEMPSVSEYLADLNSSDTLTEQGKKQKIMELQSKIAKMEDDQLILEELKNQHLTFKDLLDFQALNLKDKQWCASATDTSHKTRDYVEAVCPDQPCVRDFAVTLAMNHSGAYNGYERGKPSEIGIKQLCDIHTHISNKWKYVNDPILHFSDYISRADRTIALGLGGDCDDFSVVMASCSEAIGATTRIMHGECDGGGHAWCEILLGNEQNKEMALNVLYSYYGLKKHKVALSKDENGEYWLPLDWQIGDYTCNSKGEASVAYSPKMKLKHLTDLEIERLMLEKDTSAKW